MMIHLNYIHWLVGSEEYTVPGSDPFTFVSQESALLIKLFISWYNQKNYTEAHVECVQPMRTISTFTSGFLFMLQLQNKLWATKTVVYRNVACSKGHVFGAVRSPQSILIYRDKHVSQRRLWFCHITPAPFYFTWTPLWLEAGKVFICPTEMYWPTVCHLTVTLCLWKNKHI